VDENRRFTSVDGAFTEVLSTVDMADKNVALFKKPFNAVGLFKPSEPDTLAVDYTFCDCFDTCNG
jgi:hypothetical protein